MPSLLQNDDAYKDLSSDDDDDDGFDDDIEALRRACTLAGTNLSDLNIENGENNTRYPSAEVDRESSGGEGDEDEDDFKLFRNIKNRFLMGTDLGEPLYLKPICAIPFDLDDEEDDFETLCAVRKRFVAYDNSGKLRKYG